jgi:hypothetical protein
VRAFPFIICSHGYLITIQFHRTASLRKYSSVFTMFTLNKCYLTKATFRNVTPTLYNCRWDSIIVHVLTPILQVWSRHKYSYNLAIDARNEICVRWFWIYKQSRRTLRVLWRHLLSEFWLVATVSSNLQSYCETKRQTSRYEERHITWEMNDTFNI